MTIKIFLADWGIEGKEDDVIEKDLIQIIEDNGCKVKKVSLETDKIRKGKWFKVELANSEEEQQIVNEIKQKKLYDKLDIRPTVYYEIIIKNIPNNLSEENLKEELNKMGNFKPNNISVKIGKRECAFITVNSLDEANNLITNLNNQVLMGKHLKVEFTELKQKRERTSSVSSETVEQKTIETNLTHLGNFYNESDYDLVTEKLKEFVYGICTYLSNLPPQQKLSQLEQEQNESD